MKTRLQIVLLSAMILFAMSCDTNQKNQQTPPSRKEMTAEQILGNPKYQAISYGGYRQGTRQVQPSINELKEAFPFVSMSSSFDVSENHLKSSLMFLVSASTL